MCVRIIRSIRVTSPWDADRRTITIPASVSLTAATDLVRAVLAALDVIQPALGAVCYCGEAVDVAGAMRAPAQQWTSEVIYIGS